MKKIPSLFKRDYKGHRRVYNQVVEGCEWVLRGEGTPTEKYDGTACMIQGGGLYKRYDRKRSKKTGKYKDAPEGWMPCEDGPNQHTGHWPGWVPAKRDDPASQYHLEAFLEWRLDLALNWTYELVGPKVQSNPYGLQSHQLWKHGTPFPSEIERTFSGIKKFLQKNMVEGIVWHHPDGRMAKIKRRDFGFEWPAEQSRGEKYYD